MAARAETLKKAAAPKAATTSKRTKGGGSRTKASAESSQNGNGSPKGKTVAEVLSKVNKTGLDRLGKGGLESLVVAHLAAHPKAEVTPSELGNKLNRSSGAIGNALERLVKAGKAVRTSDRPRRYKYQPAKAARARKAKQA
jgi:DNA-binding MarR family transcriptional regulator